LVSKLDLRVVRDQVAFASLNPRSIGFRVQARELIIGFAGARSGDGRFFGRGFSFPHPALPQRGRGDVSGPQRGRGD
jgi:hypothetical protein